MVNVANLNPEPFKEILDGKKRSEWRIRRRLDSRLEAVKVGEPVFLLEIGKSTRAIEASVRAAMRFDYENGMCQYAIRLKDPKLINVPGIRKLQGWHRREKL
jgi:hypothetical protein